jgi:hypothetical protein
MSEADDEGRRRLAMKEGELVMIMKGKSEKS